MEDLTKQQLVLLTLLLSFVTSIGTGIITVSLIGEAPDTVTQTINRVVEKTIETVTPTKETIKETQTKTQVVVEKDDAITAAVEKASKSLVRVYTVDGEAKKFFAIGVVVNSEGVVVATVSGYVDGFKYAGVYADGSEYELRITTDYVSGKNTVVLLPVREEGDEKTFDAADLIASDKLKLGQSIINIGGDKDTSIQVGRIASLLKEKTEDDVEYITSIITDISSATPGSVITNFSGAIVGYNAYVNDLKQQKSFITVGELVAKKAGESEEPPTNNNP